MKRNKGFFRAVALLLAALLLLGTAASALAAGGGAADFDADTIYISRADELIALARHCTLDTWSQGKTVVLRADISLKGTDFSPIPSFGGTFDGGGHTISGLQLEGGECPAGLFGIVQRGGVVKNLMVRGSVVPSGDADTLGGIVGINYGKLTGCTFQGYVGGKSTVGGVAGLNETTGQMINCFFRGAVTGEHYVGGIVGQNTGSLVQCSNYGSINTTEISVEADLLDLDISRFNSTENVPAGTDIGGVAGFSTGLIQSCKNTGNVGYEHMGYNVGGIVGRQSGYLDGCVNTGTIRGRKDVGGIAGQLEPQVTLKYSEDTLSSLWDELDVLEQLMDRALSDAEGASDAISGSMSELTASVGTAKDTAVGLTDAMTEWANGNIDQINDASARLSWVLGQMEPILDDLGGALEQAEIAAGQFSDALDDAELAAEWGDKAVEALQNALTDLQNASGHGRDAYAHVKKAVDALEASLGDTEITKAALKDLVDATAKMASAFSQIAGAMSGIGRALDQVYQDAQKDPYWQDLRDGVDDLRSALVEISGALAQVSGALETIREEFDSEENTPTNKELLKDAMEALKAATEHLETAYEKFSAALDAYENGDIYGEGGALDQLGQGMDELNEANGQVQQAIDDIDQIIDNMDTQETRQALEDLADGLADLNAGLGHANDAIVKIDTALREIENDPRYEQTKDEIYDYLGAINDALDKISTASDRISRAIKDLERNLDPDALDRAWKEIKYAADDAELAADDLDAAVSNLKLALEYLEKAGEYGSDAMSDLNKASETMGKAISLLRKATEQTADVIHELAEKPAIQFTPISSDLTERGNALDNALSQVLDQVDALNGTMSSSSDILLADLRAINRQVGVIIDLMRQVSEEAQEKEAAEGYEDISDQELFDDRTWGRISDTRNKGTVEGDVNVAGIVGSMAIEYDFDPEDDLTETGSRSLDFHYQTVAVVTGSVNEGAVTAKKDCAGGIVGRMDLGTVYACESYGSVKSSSGDYVGGIAGQSDAAIRNCFAKCSLSGVSYVGGVLGAGGENSVTQGCCTLVRITDCEQHAGAVSGTEDGSFEDNRFVSDELAGLGRVSYAGKAEPISYEALTRVEGLPAPFRSFTLRFEADGVALRTETFAFGASFGSEVYPEAPEKAGYYVQWDTEELNDLRFDTLVTAVYKPYVTALSSQTTREDGRAVFYAEGAFRGGDSMEARELNGQDADFAGIPNTLFRNWELLELWRVSFSEDGQETHTLRFLRPDGEGRIQVFVRENGGWERVKGQEIGRYLSFNVESTQAEIAVFSVTLVWWVWLLLALPPLLLLILVSVKIGKKRKKKRRAAAAARLEAAQAAAEDEENG